MGFQLRSKKKLILHFYSKRCPNGYLFDKKINKCRRKTVKLKILKSSPTEVVQEQKVEESINQNLKEDESPDRIHLPQ